MPYIEVCQTFLSAEAKRENKDWQGASEEFAELSERETPFNQIVQTSLTESRLNLAEEQHKAGKYEAAIETYRLIDVTDETIKKEVEKKITQTYFDWVPVLKQHAEIQRIEDFLVDLWNSDTLNYTQAIEAGLTDDDLAKALSRSSGTAAQKLIHETLINTCNGEPSDSIAIANSETHKAMMLRAYPNKREGVIGFITLTEQSFKALKDENIPQYILDKLRPIKNTAFANEADLLTAIEKKIRTGDAAKYKTFFLKHADIPLPDEWKATRPGDFYYAICIKRREDVLPHICKYTGGVTLTLKQVVWSVEIREPRTGKQIIVIEEKGEKLPGCPEKIPSIGGTWTTRVGADPSASETLNRIMQALDGLGS